MWAELLTNSLVLLFGYAYPAFECFKMVEQRPGHIEQLRFWCQYWIIVALLTIIERVAHVVVSALPMYGEAKLAFLVYLWYPKTKGTNLVYESFLQPVVVQYEPDIEHRLRYLRANSGKLLMFYLKNFTDRGSALFVEALNYVVAQSNKVSKSRGWFSFSKKKQEPGLESTIANLMELKDDLGADPHGARPRHRQPHKRY